MEENPPGGARMRPTIGELVREDAGESLVCIKEAIVALV